MGRDGSLELFFEVLLGLGFVYGGLEVVQTAEFVDVALGVGEGHDAAELGFVQTEGCGEAADAVVIGA